MAVGGYGLWVVPRVQDEGRHGLVPNFLLVYYVPHLRLPQVYPHPRLDTKVRELLENWETPEGQKKLRRHMRLWLALGLVDPSGYYGDPKLKTVADINANLGNWTAAGALFQDVMPMEDLPKWARWAAIQTQINNLFLWVEPTEEDGDLSQVFVRGNRRWDVQIGDMVIAVRSRDQAGPPGMTLIGKLAEIPKSADKMLACSPERLEQLGWRVPDQDTKSGFIPPPHAVLRSTSSGKYSATVRITEAGNLIGEYSVDFELEPLDWQNPNLRFLKATRTAQLGD